MTSSARNILIGIVLLGIFYWLWKPGITQKPVVDKVAERANLLGQENEVDKKADRPSPTPEANTPANESLERLANQGTQPTPPKDEASRAQYLITVQAARRMAWDSMPTEPKAMDEFFALKELSANHPPPSEGEAKYFRGLRDLSDSRAKYIEMRFENDKWIVSDGMARDQMTPWPSRDVIPFKDQPDIWTLYYGDSMRLFLRHFHKVAIPEMDGDFEVLSGWLFNHDQIWRVVMIGTDKGWPSESLFHELKPGHD